MRDAADDTMKFVGAVTLLLFAFAFVALSYGQGPDEPCVTDAYPPDPR